MDEGIGANNSAVPNRDRTNNHGAWKDQDTVTNDGSAPISGDGVGSLVLYVGTYRNALVNLGVTPDGGPAGDHDARRVWQEQPPVDPDAWLHLDAVGRQCNDSHNRAKRSWHGLAKPNQQGRVDGRVDDRLDQGTRTVRTIESYDVGNDQVRQARAALCS